MYLQASRCCPGRTTSRLVIALLVVVGSSGCAPYRLTSVPAPSHRDQTVFCAGPGSSRGPGARGTSECFYVDRRDLERFMNGQLRL